MSDIKKASLVIKNASQVLTCARDAQDKIGLVSNGWIALRGEKILKVGDDSGELQNFIECGTEIIDAQGCVAAPGFVDCHTHVVFGGSRVDEYAAKLTNADPEELKRRKIPTGINATINATRRLAEDELYEQTAQRVKEMILSGTTTLESKSGYGLDIDTEMKQLRVNKRLAGELPIDIVSTFLGGHGWPSDMPKAAYMDLLINEMTPQVATSGLAEFCDVWCDEGHYNLQECRDILAAGVRHGLKAKIHTDAYSYIGGSELAADMQMISADHLNYTPRSSMKKMKSARVAAVVLPGIDFSVRHAKPFDARPLIEEGLELALATNCCPGCWCTSMPLIMILACRNHNMSPEEAIRAATYGAAYAVRRHEKTGSIEPGKQADIQIWDVPRYEDVIYRMGVNPVDTVIRHGKITVKDKKIIF